MHRVVVPDFIGFGRSDKYVDYRMYNSSLHKLTLGIVLSQAGIYILHLNPLSTVWKGGGGMI